MREWGSVLPLIKCVPMLRRMILLFGVCGFLVAVLPAVAWDYLIGHTSINPHNAPLLSVAADWLWPTNLMLMAWHKGGRWGNALGILLSAFANGVIYSFVGLIFWTMVKLISVEQQGHH
jgi:hypothetical protein